ncbi:hypothetical protein BCR44DRAFT_1425361 [Catenaria anguillulae PL171]|uniref:Prokaryotic-type class I peptide chain release factors domain-containing protein n=1 Tax=Catenaria anguillulae PL171 TaxID=765915 RepID=A0A1Y2I1I9_9FUNG|nr:hypothetical protein BCR44DRAFT_1425361 [Catenaria anguillulae PL171]
MRPSAIRQAAAGLSSIITGPAFPRVAPTRWLRIGTFPAAALCPCTNNAMVRRMSSMSASADASGLYQQPIQNSIHPHLLTLCVPIVNPITLLTTPKVIHKLATISTRVTHLQSTLEHERDPTAIATLSRELSDLEPISDLFAQFQATRTALADLQPLLDDPDMRALALDEQSSLADQLQSTAGLLLRHLLPKDIADDGSAVLEVRAGAGGSEAALFARDLFGMYSRFADTQGWMFQPAHVSETDEGGFKDATATIKGPGVFRQLKLESGVHRVQRVPLTESQGRIHTSTVTVAVLPMPEQVDKLVTIPDKELRIDVYRASGAGGQHVNTTESAVRITHLPTGLVVAIQDERSQHKNKAKAMSILRAKLYDVQRRKVEEERRKERRGQIGTGDRSERIRTYNYPQSRVTDHRIGLTVHDLEGVVMGGRLAEIVEALAVRAEVEALAAMNEDKA